MDFSVPLTHHDPTDLELICLVKKRKIRFRIPAGFKNPMSDFLKETQPNTLIHTFSADVRLKVFL